MLKKKNLEAAVLGWDRILTLLLKHRIGWLGLHAGTPDTELNNLYVFIPDFQSAKLLVSIPLLHYFF